MLDYLEVKKFHAKKLAEDAEGEGRVESAFYHTMKMVYLKGVEDGRQVLLHGDSERANTHLIGIVDRRLERLVDSVGKEVSPASDAHRVE